MGAASVHVLHPRSGSRRRALLLAVAVLLSLTALLAIGILLFGRFGRTESRILGTTGALGGFALLTLPAAMLLDRRRAPLLAAASIALASVGAVLAVVAIWTEAGTTLGRSLGTALILLLATVQCAALTVRRSTRDPRSVRSLYVASFALAAIVAAMWTTAIWLGDDITGVYARVLGAFGVLDVLVVALQPVLARARPEPLTMRVRVSFHSGASEELTLAAPDAATAASQAIRQAERGGRRVRAVELLGPRSEEPARRESETLAGAAGPEADRSVRHV